MADFDVESVAAQLAKTQVGKDDDEAEGFVSFAGQGLKLDSESDADDIVDAIQKCQSMKMLNLEGNTFGVEAAKAVAKAIESHPELEKALWKDMFTSRLKSEIPKALMFLGSGLILAGAHLVELDLSDNAFGPIGVEGISELLKSPVCYSLQTLRMNNNGLGIHGAKLLSKVLVDCHKNSNDNKSPLNLKTFICGRNRMENDGAKAIASMIEVIGTLEELQMPQNSIFHEGVSALAKALQSNVNLKYLNLNDNILTEEGAKAMCTVLPKLQDLEVINFGDCLLKSEGGIALAKVLRKGHTKLKELYLGYNELDYHAAKEIVRSLHNKPHLEKLELNGNQFGNSGCDEIKSVLEDMDKLNILGALSEDESDDGDDDEDNYEDQDSEGKDEEEDDQQLQQERNEEIPPITPMQSTATEFLTWPSAERLLGIGNNRASTLAEAVSREPNGPEKYIEIFMKVSLVIRSDNEELKEATYQCADLLLERGFREADERGTVSMFANNLLAHLGLIKSEDKSVIAPRDLSGTLMVLEHCVRQPYFPRATKEMLQLFLSSRFHDSVERTGKIKHMLMQALYQY